MVARRDGNMLLGLQIHVFGLGIRKKGGDFKDIMLTLIREVLS